MPSDDKPEPADRSPETVLSDARLERVLASLTVDDVNPPSPPVGLWERIEDQIDSDGSDQQPATLHPVPPLPSSATSESPPTSSPPLSAPSSPERATTAHQRLRWLAAAAAIVFIVAGTLVALGQNSQTRVVATAELQYEDGFDAAGATARASANLVERDGQYQITLSDPDLPADLGEPADLELWLIEARADGSLDVQPVGIIANGDGTFSVPDGINPRTHNIVDISIEPRDGDATHSGRSILRGPLEEV